MLGWGGFPTKLERLGRVLPLLGRRAAEVREVDLPSDNQVIVRLRAPLPDDGSRPRDGGGDVRRS